MLSGDSGCGKTMIARSLLHELDPSRTEIALMGNPCRDGDEFLREILYQLGDEITTDLDRQRTVHRIHEIVYEAHAQGRETIVVVDEAQLQQDESIFEEMRLLLNLQLDDAFLITLLLVGQPPLVDSIRRHGSLDQRIATRGVLRPFSDDDTRTYIDFRLKTAGREEAIFHPEAIDLIHGYTSGVPRKINNLCDIALVIGHSRKLQGIDADWAQRLIQAERGDGA
jgi:general secretion pathway protein A